MSMIWQPYLYFKDGHQTTKLSTNPGLRPIGDGSVVETCVPPPTQSAIQNHNDITKGPKGGLKIQEPLHSIYKCFYELRMLLQY